MPVSPGLTRVLVQGDPDVVAELWTACDIDRPLFSHDGASRRTHVEPMLVRCWASVADAGQHQTSIGSTSCDSASRPVTLVVARDVSLGLAYCLKKAALRPKSTGICCFAKSLSPIHTEVIDREYCLYFFEMKLALKYHALFTASFFLNITERTRRKIP